MAEWVIVPAILMVLAGFAVARGLYRLVIGNRSPIWQFAVALAGLGLGLRPAIDGNVVGYASVTVGALAAQPLAADVVDWLGDVTGLGRRWDRWWRARRPRRTGAPRVDVVDDGAITELDRAAALVQLVDADHDRLSAAAGRGDVRVQLESSLALARTSRRLSEVLQVVAAERDRIAGHHRR